VGVYLGEELATLETLGGAPLGAGGILPAGEGALNGEGVGALKAGAGAE